MHRARARATGTYYRESRPDVTLEPAAAIVSWKRIGDKRQEGIYTDIREREREAEKEREAYDTGI